MKRDRIFKTRQKNEKKKEEKHQKTVEKQYIYIIRVCIQPYR